MRWGRVCAAGHPPLRQVDYPAHVHRFPKFVLTLDHPGCGMADDGIRVTNLADWLQGREG